MAYASQYALDSAMHTHTMGIRTSARCDFDHSIVAFSNARPSEMAFVLFPTAECSRNDTGRSYYREILYIDN